MKKYMPFKKTPNKTLAQATVEFALILPILLTLIFGIFEVSRAIFSYAMIYAGAREGVRFGASVGDADGDGLLNFQDYQEIKSKITQYTRFANTPAQDICIYFAQTGVLALPPTPACTGAEFTAPSKENVDSNFGTYRIVVRILDTFDTVAPIPLPSINLFASSARTVASNIPVTP